MVLGANMIEPASKLKSTPHSIDNEALMRELEQRGLVKLKIDEASGAKLYYAVSNQLARWQH
jgi:hypothetical protein